MQLISNVNGLHVCILICRLAGVLMFSIKNGFRIEQHPQATRSAKRNATEIGRLRILKTNLAL
jgi:hypothetical protein